MSGGAPCAQQPILQSPIQSIQGKNLDFSRSTIPTVGRYEKYGVFLELIVRETVVIQQDVVLTSHNFYLCEYDYLDVSPVLMLHMAINQFIQTHGNVYV